MTGPGRTWWPALLVTAGCSGLFGLDDAVLDSDGDGIADGEDTCPDLADPTQADADRDGVGNACDDCFGLGLRGTDADGDGVDDGCDACQAGAAEDSDGDGIEDRCVPATILDEDVDGVIDDVDRCPVHPDPAQVDADADGLGDACDPTAAADTRALFASFALDDPGLVPPPGWRREGGELVISETGGMATSASTVDAMVAQVEVVLALAVGESVGVRLNEGGLTSLACLVGADGRALMVQARSIGPDQVDMSPTTVPVTGPVAVRLILTPNQLAAGVNAGCEVEAAGGQVTRADGGLVGERSGSPRIEANLATPSTARVRYLWVVDAAEALP